MRVRIAAALAAALAAVPANAGAQNHVYQEFPTNVEVNPGEIEARLSALGFEGAVERNWARAELADAAQSQATGTLKPNTVLFISKSGGITRDGRTGYEVHEYEFVFTYTPTTQIIRGGLQYETAGRWVTAMSEAWGDDGTLTFKTGTLVGDEMGFRVFVENPNVAGVRTPPTIRYNATLNRVSGDGGTDPPRPTNWTASGSGNDIIDIPDDVLRFRITGNYSGYISNFIVVCGLGSGVASGLLVNEILGTGGSSTSYSGVHLNTGEYSTRRNRPCGSLRVQDSTGVSWTMTQLTSR